MAHRSYRMETNKNFTLHFKTQKIEWLDLQPVLDTNRAHMKKFKGMLDMVVQAYISCLVESGGRRIS
jgi:hypothetical protein